MSAESDLKALPTAASLLFAYGTLQRNGQYHRILEACGATFLAEARTRVPYPLIVTDYPCLLDLPGKGFHVTGELYRIPLPEDWRALDTLEGHPNEYERRLEPVESAQGVHPAWVYFYQKSVPPLEAHCLLERFDP